MLQAGPYCEETAFIEQPTQQGLTHTSRIEKRPLVWLNRMYLWSAWRLSAQHRMGLDSSDALPSSQDRENALSDANREGREKPNQKGQC